MRLVGYDIFDGGVVLTAWLCRRLCGGMWAKRSSLEEFVKSGEFVPTIADNSACGCFVVVVNVWPVARAFTDGKGFGYSVTPDTTSSQMSLLLGLREFDPCSQASGMPVYWQCYERDRVDDCCSSRMMSFLREAPTEFLAVRRVSNPANVRRDTHYTNQEYSYQSGGYQRRI